jgi:hypothetical protein
MRRGFAASLADAVFRPSSVFAPLHPTLPGGGLAGQEEPASRCMPPRRRLAYASSAFSSASD